MSEIAFGQHHTGQRGRIGGKTAAILIIITNTRECLGLLEMQISTEFMISGLARIRVTDLGSGVMRSGVPMVIYGIFEHASEERSRLDIQISHIHG